MNSLQKSRDDLAQVERELLAMPQREGLKVTEMHLPGIYVRHLFIPEETVLTGMIHKENCINILASGVIQVWTETEGMRPLKGFYMFESEAGSKRVGKTYTDVHWVNIFPVDKDIKPEDVIGAVTTMDYDDPGIKRLAK